MSRKFLVDVDLAKNSLLNAVVQVLASDPGSPVEGQVYYNSVSKKLRQYNGSTWTEYGTGAGAGDVNGPASSVDNELVLFSGTTGKAIKAMSGTGLVKVTSGAASVATGGTDYLIPGGNLGTPTGGLLTNCSGLPVSTGIAGLGSNVATFLATPTSANLRSALTDEVGTGSAYFTGGDLSTPAGGLLTNCSGLPISTGIAGLAANVATFLATPTSANLRAVLTDEVGTGTAYFVGGDLGTPAGGILTNCSGTASALTAGTVTTNANLTGHITSVGNTTSLGSFTKAQLDAAVSDGNVLYVGDVTSNATHTGDATGSTALTVVALNGVNLAGLATGLLKNTTGTGAPSIATAGTDYVTNASTGAFTNKTFDANGTGNSISNLETADFATNVIDNDTALSANSSTRLATQQATKAYIDNLVQGISWKTSVRAATTVAGTLASSFENGDIIDGVTLATNDRILIKDQGTGGENGIYIVNSSGAPTRASDCNTSAEILQAAVLIQEGTVNAETVWVNTTNAPITLGTTATVWAQINGGTVPTATDTVAGKVELATVGESEAKSDTTRAVTPAGLATFPRKYSVDIGNGSSTSITVTHNLGTKDVITQVRQNSDDAVVECDIDNDTTNTVVLTFAVAPTSNALRAVVIG